MEWISLPYRVLGVKVDFQSRSFIERDFPNTLLEVLLEHVKVSRVISVVTVLVVYIKSYRTKKLNILIYPQGFE